MTTTGPRCPQPVGAAAPGASTSSGGFFWGRPAKTAKDYARPEDMPRNLPQHTWWQEHAGDPVYPGARVTNMDAIFKVVSIWNDHSMTISAFSDTLGFITELLPQGHTLPKSLYMMKQVLDVAPASKYEWHSCLLGCTGWPPTPQSEWKAHRQDCCKKCGGARFDVVLGKEVPVRRFWYIRPQESIEELMMDPDFVTAIRTAKAKVVGNYWDSPEGTGSTKPQVVRQLDQAMA